jgi:hypothetical protein
MKTCQAIIPVQPQQQALSTTTINSNNNYDHCNVNNGTVNNINNITVQLRNYGDEFMTHITEALKDAMVQKFNGKGISTFIENVHFNPDIPENHNIRKHSKTQWKIFNNGDWIIRSFKNTINDLIQRYKDILYVHLLDPDFEQRINCEVSLRLILENFQKFDVEKTPLHFYRCVRDIIDLVENLEIQYEKEQKRNQASTTIAAAS